jgi:hypothetical protein
VKALRIEIFWLRALQEFWPRAMADSAIEVQAWCARAKVKQGRFCEITPVGSDSLREYAKQQ